MCGIFGFYQREGAPLPPGLAEAMGQTLVHRGPDDVGIFTRPGVSLGNRRLSIIDVAGGHRLELRVGDGQGLVLAGVRVFGERGRAFGRRGVGVDEERDRERGNQQCVE